MRSFVRVVPGLLLAAGCGGSPPGGAVHSRATYDPAALTAAAFAEYDRNNNGLLEGAELDACPGLKAGLAGIDTNRDGKISKAELQARFEAYAAANTASVSATATVTLDGQPLADATVQFVPEAFMGGAVQEATGKTGPDGTVSAFTSGGKQYVGLQPGLYKVKVTREGGAALPARYNTQTTLGAEVFGGRGAKPLVFALSGR
jgi:hypothetical protein